MPITGLAAATRRRHLALWTTATLLGSGLVLVSPVGSSEAEAGTWWQRVYRTDFADLTDVGRAQTNIEVNSTLSPTDTTNILLQKPTLRENTVVVPDSAAADGKALGVLTRVAAYQTDSGTKVGWTNGRMVLTNNVHEVPIRIRARMRFTRSIGVKASVMWWPENGWPWEVDFAEVFSGDSLTTGNGSRQNVAQRWHADLDGDGAAKEQIAYDIPLDATKYHVYDLRITRTRMSIWVDGKLMFATEDKRFIPTGRGFFTVGKALGKIRDRPDRTEDGVYLDWVELYKMP